MKNKTKKQTQVKKNNKKKILLGTLIPIGALAVTAAVVTPVVITLNNRNNPIISPWEASLVAIKSEKTSDGDLKCTLTVKEGKIKEITGIKKIKKGDHVLEEVTDYTYDEDNNIVVIKKAALEAYQGQIVIKPIVQDPVPLKTMTITGSHEQDIESLGGITVTGEGEEVITPSFRCEPKNIINVAQDGKISLATDSTGGSVKIIAKAKGYKEASFDVEVASFSKVQFITVGGILKVFAAGVIGQRSLITGTLVIPSRHWDDANNQFIEIKNLYTDDDSDGSFAFTSITKVIIPDSIVDLESNAFFDCQQLTDIKFSSNLTAISAGAFDQCGALVEVNIPNNIKSIGEKAFNGCIALERITLPSGVTAIGDSAFKSCSALKNITLPNDLETIGKEAFGYSGLTTITIPSKVDKINKFAFQGCTNLGSVTFSEPTYWKQIEGGQITIGADAEGIKTNATNLKNDEAGEDDNWGYTGIERKLPEKITKANFGEIFETYRKQQISDTTKYTLDQVSKLMLNNVETKVVNLTYNNRKCNLTYDGGTDPLKIDIQNGLGPWSGIEALFSNNKDATYVKNNDNSLEYSYSEGETIKHIKINEFGYIVQATMSVGNVTTTFELTFAGEPQEIQPAAEKNFAISGGLVSLKDDSECWTDVKTIVIPEKVGGVTVTGIANHGFSNTSSGKICKATSISFENPDNITSIGEYAFQQSSLKSFYVPKNVNSIGQYAFYECSNLLSCLFDENCKLSTIAYSAFRKTGLLEMLVPDTVTTIDGYAFNSSSSLKNIKFGENSKLQTINRYAFNGAGITSIVFPKTVTTVGQKAFMSCPNLTYAKICKSTVSISIDTYCFEEDSNLKTVVIEQQNVYSGITADYNSFGKLIAYADTIMIPNGGNPSNYIKNNFTNVTIGNPYDTYKKAA